MATYIALVNFTPEGVANIQDTTKRSADFVAAVEKLGVMVKDVYWTMGAYDGALIFDAPDDETASAALLALNARGKASTTTLRAFDSSEMETILAKM